MEYFELNVSKAGNKFLLYIPIKFKEKLLFSKGELIKISLYLNNKYFSLITRYNSIITLRKKIAKELKIKEGCKIKTTFEKFSEIKRPSKMFFENKVDLLYFLPKKSRKGSKISFEELIIGRESFLRVFSIHSRGSSKEILLKRFIEPRIFGGLLGQIQAEGTKGNFNVVEFCNKNLLELKDFIQYMEHLNIKKENLFVKLDYHPIFEANLDQISKDFINATGISVNYRSVSSGRSKGYGFKIILHNTVISELILNSLKRIREILEKEKLRGDILVLSEGYLSKILCGDGTFELTSRSRKKFQARVKIYDGNLNFLKHYLILLSKFGFKSYINEKYFFVRAMCNYPLAKRLLEIQAFNTNKNIERIHKYLTQFEATTR
jgi:hypothetical protein